MNQTVFHWGWYDDECWDVGNWCLSNAILCFFFAAPFPLAGFCSAVCVEVPSETEAVQGTHMKLLCISCMKREEVTASTMVEWFYRPDGGKDEPVCMFGSWALVFIGLSVKHSPVNSCWEKPKGIYESVSLSCSRIPKEDCIKEGERPKYEPKLSAGLLFKAYRNARQPAFVSWRRDEPRVQLQAADLHNFCSIFTRRYHSTNFKQ